jgi:hypothetical protein
MATGALKRAVKLAGEDKADALAMQKALVKLEQALELAPSDTLQTATDAFATETQKALDAFAFEFARDLKEVFEQRGERVEGRPPTLVVGELVLQIDIAARKAQWFYGKEALTRSMDAFRMLRSLAQTIRALSYSGLILLLDEVDRMASIGGKAEKLATDNLREVIDRCRDEMPGAMFVYAVPPQFINDVAPRYPALQQRVRAPGRFSRTNHFSPQISLEHLDLAVAIIRGQVDELSGGETPLY